ncbi:MAG TPA: FHA domain-containing protein [Gammaproteobacteria bacterium]
MATLQKLGDEAKCLLDQVQMRIGRLPDNEIILTDEAVSGHHALITIRPLARNENQNEYIIEDLNSTNKTYVNNLQISRHALKDGDIVRLGNTRLKFSTKNYVPPQTPFNQTQKLDPKKPQGYIFPK